MTSRPILASLAWLALVPAASAASLEMPRVFADGMVLQRDRPLPVWGQAQPGCQVRVTLDGAAASATAGAEGRWAATLPARAAGGPYVLAVDACGQRRQISDVLVGEVWLASGQSNMEWPVAQTLHAQEDIAAAGDPQLRHFKVPRAWAEAPRAQLEGGQWQAASPAAVGAFSAAGYAFARELRRTLGVPVGIIDSTWGGSSIEAWMSAGMLGLDAAELEAKMRGRRQAEAQVEAAVRQRLLRWPPVDPASDAFAAAELDTSSWAEIEVPGLWEAHGYAGMDGVAWYRTTFELTAAEAAAGVTLGVGQIDDTDTTWVNGRPVGGMASAHNKPRVYQVPAAALRAGTNVVAVRVQDDGGGGGIDGAQEEIYVQPAGGRARPLPGPWRFRAAQVTVAMQDGKNQTDTLLYNAMLHPLQPYALAGVIWYQGESNAGEGAYRYRHQFRALIEGWRAGFHAPRLPFLWVQLAPFHSGDDRLDAQGRVLDSPWATLRESQSATLALPATGQAVITDVGDTDDIHPRDKRTVGDRLARIALHQVYARPGRAWTGPVYRNAEPRGRELVLHFDHADGALAARGGGPLAGFELAGKDGRFHPARARIEGDAVVLDAREVPRPVSARYGWSDDPQEANLVGRDGLPASPFRSGQW